MLLFPIGAILINLSLIALTIEPKYQLMDVICMVRERASTLFYVCRNYTYPCISRIHIHTHCETHTLVGVFVRHYIFTQHIVRKKYSITAIDIWRVARIFSQTKPVAHSAAVAHDAHGVRAAFKPAIIWLCLRIQAEREEGGPRLRRERTSAEEGLRHASRAGAVPAVAGAKTITSAGGARALGQQMWLRHRTQSECTVLSGAPFRSPPSGEAAMRFIPCLVQITRASAPCAGAPAETGGDDVCEKSDGQPKAVTRAWNRSANTAACAAALIHRLRFLPVMHPFRVGVSTSGQE